MLNGDISNEGPKRILVAESLIVMKQPRLEKKFKVFPSIKYDVLYDRIMLNKLWQYTTKHEVTLELISFEHDYDQLGEIYEKLDSAGLNPFRGYSYYKSPGKLAKDLAFRPEVVGVLDPENQLRYGSKGLDL